MTKKILKPLLLLLFTASFQFGFGQAVTGRVVINEYLPWPSSPGCGVTSEFVELLNFGPGAINIGCYILTDGDYSVTIPPNTILQAGEFYVIAGQNIIGINCANIDSAIRVDLNWNTCGCSSGAIPTTGDGWFTDGGTASEQVVLLDPNKNVVDAVIRSLPAETSSPITTSSVSGGCSAKTFDLDTMSINYETIGESLGKGNSYARIVDGDCGWDKQPHQSGNATNNTRGGVTDIDYTLNIVNSQDCDSLHGEVDIDVKHADYSVVFPMSYVVAYDSDNDGDFDFNDTYTTGTDNTSPNVTISGLILGRYRITLGSVKGCYLHNFDFSILSCTGVLPVRLTNFKLSIKSDQSHLVEWQLTETENLQSVVLEMSSDGRNYQKQLPIDVKGLNGTKYFSRAIPANSGYHFYRLKVTTKDGKSFYSSVVGSLGNGLKVNRAWPNPVQNSLFLNLNSDVSENAVYKVYNTSGTLMLSNKVSLPRGVSDLQIPVQNLPAGVYQLIIIKPSDPQPFSHRFVKQ